MKNIIQSDLELEIAVAGEDGLIFVALWSPWCSKCEDFLKLIAQIEDEYDEIQFIAVEVEQLGVLEVSAIPAVVLYSKRRKIYEGLASSSRDVLIDFLDSWASIEKCSQHVLLSANQARLTMIDTALRRAAVRLEAVSARLNALNFGPSYSLRVNSAIRDEVRFKECIPMGLPAKGVECIYIIRAISPECKIDIIDKEGSEFPSESGSLSELAEVSQCKSGAIKVLYIGFSVDLESSLSWQLTQSVLLKHALRVNEFLGCVDFDLEIESFVFPPDYIDLKFDVEKCLKMHLKPLFDELM